MRARRAVGRWGAAGVVLLIAACSGGPATPAAPTRTGPAVQVTPSADPFAGMTVQDVMFQASAAARGASVVRLRARITGDRGYDIRTDLRLRSDDSATGSMWFGDERVTVLRRGRQLWFRAGAGYFRNIERRSPEQVSALAGRWMHEVGAPGAEDDDAFFFYTGWDAVLTQLTTDTPARWHRIGSATVEGRPMVVVSDQPTAPGHTESHIVYLPPTRLPLVARVDFPDSSPPDRMDFTEWNTGAFTVERPEGPVTEMKLG